MSDAEFVFETNIDEVARRIEQGLQQIVEATGRRGGQVPDPLEGLAGRVTQEITRSISEMRRLEAATRDLGRGARPVPLAFGDITRQMDELRSNVRRQVEEAFRGSSGGSAGGSFVQNQFQHLIDEQVRRGVEQQLREMQRGGASTASGSAGGAGGGAGRPPPPAVPSPPPAASGGGGQQPGVAELRAALIEAQRRLASQLLGKLGDPNSGVGFLTRGPGSASRFFDESDSLNPKFFQKTQAGVRELTEQGTPVDFARAQKDYAARLQARADSFSADAAKERAAQERVVQQEERLAKALAANVEAAAKSEQKLRTANLGVATQAGHQGLVPNFFAGLTSAGFGGEGGFTGNFDGLAKSAGVSAKYAVIGQALFALQNAAAQAVTELLDADDSITELEVAMGEGGNVTADFTGKLEDFAAVGGFNVGEAMDVAASGIRAFADEARSAGTPLQTLGEDFAQQASRIAVISKTTLTDASGNLKAIATGFDLSKNNVGFTRVADAIAGAKTAGGGDEKQIGQGLASSAVTFKQAGFSVEEGATLISKLSAALDESGQLAATRLSSLTSTLGGSAGKKALTDLNQQLPAGQRIDTNASERDQIDQLSKAYAGLSDAQKQVINNKIGGRSNQREFIILMKETQDALAKANAGFENKAAEEYAKRLQNLRAVLNEIVGSIKGITVNVTTSGAFDGVFLLVKTLQPALEIVRQLTSAFDKIPHSLRAVAFGALEVLAAIKAIGAVRAAGGITGVLGQIERNATPQRVVARGQLVDQVDSRLAVARTEAGGAPTAAQQARINTLEAERLNLERRYNLGISEAAGQRLAAERAGAVAAGGGIGGALQRSARLQSDAIAAVGGQAGALRDRAGLGLTRALSASPRDIVGAAGRGIGAVGRGIGSVAAGIGPIGGALIGADLALSLKSSADDIRKARNEAGQELAKQVGSSGTEMRDSAASLKTAAANISDASSGFFGSFSDFANHGAASIQAGQLQSIADERQKAASRVDTINAQERAGKTGIAGIAATIDTSTAQKITDTFKALEDTGQPAAVRLKALSAVIEGLSFSAGKGTAGLTEAQKKIFAIGSGQDSGGAFANLSKQLADSANNPLGSGRGSTGNSTIDKALNSTDKFGRFASPFSFALDKVLPNNAQIHSDRIAQVDPKIIQQTTELAVQEQLSKGVDLSSGAGAEGLKTILEAQYDSILLDPAAAKQLADEVAAGVAKKAANLGKSIDAATTISQLIQQGIADAPKAGADAGSKAQRIALETGGTDKSSLAASAASRQALAATRRSVQGALQRAVASGDLTKEQADTALIPLIQAQDAAEISNLQALQQSAEQDISELEQARRSQQSKAKSKAQIKAVGQRFLKLEAVKAVSANDTGALIAILDNASRDEIAIVTDAVNQDLKVRAAAANARAATARAAATLAGTQARGGIGEHSGSGVDDRTPEQVALDKQAATAQKVLKDAISKSNPSPKSVYTTGSDVPSIKAADAAAKKKQEPTAAQVAAARSTANAQALGGELVLAAAGILTAKADLAAAKKGTVEYYKALGSYYQALQQQRQAFLDVRKINSQLKSDLTDPVAQAKIDVDIANQKLLQDTKRKASADVIGKDKVDLRSAQNSAESAAFSQRLSDVQTADQLGQISHSAYLSYLRNEHNRLVAVKNRTRQQQDELNQIDLAIKSAADALSGQFNIGDIKVPTPYEARRYIAATSAGANYNGGSNSTTIYIDGTDVGLVQQILRESLGTSATTRTVVSSRKVGAA